MIIGIQDLATTILRGIEQILSYTFEVIRDLLKFIYSFQIVNGLFRLIGDVLEFAFTNTVWKPMKYYWDYVGEPTFRVRTFDHYGTIHLRRRQIFTIFDPYPPTIGIPAKCL